MNGQNRPSGSGVFRTLTEKCSIFIYIDRYIYAILKGWPGWPFALLEKQKISELGISSIQRALQSTLFSADKIKIVVNMDGHVLFSTNQIPWNCYFAQAQAHVLHIHYYCSSKKIHQMSGQPLWFEIRATPNSDSAELWRASVTFFKTLIFLSKVA